MDKLIEKVQQHVVPVVGKIADKPYVGAIGKAFSAFLPLTLLGSVTVLLGCFNIEWYLNFIQSTGLQTFFFYVYNLSIGLFSIWTALALGYFYAQALKLNRYAFIISIVNLFAFLVVTPYVTIESVNYFSLSDFGASGVFTVMLLTPIVVRTYKICVEKNIRIKMPESVPSYISDSFSSIIPAIIVSVIAYLLLKLAQAMGYSSLTSAIYSVIGTPLIWLASQPWGSCFMFALGYAIQSCFGIHGSVILAFMLPITQPMMIENVNAYLAGDTLPYMYPYSFFVYLDVIVIAHVIALLTSKQARFKELGKLCAFPAIFAVTEPVNFGIPMVFNPYLVIPNMFIPFINFFFVSLLMKIGILPYCHAMYIFGMPVLLSGYLQGGIMGVVAQLLVIALDTVLFIPFFKAYEKSTETTQQNA